MNMLNGSAAEAENQRATQITTTLSFLVSLPSPPHIEPTLQCPVQWRKRVTTCHRQSLLIYICSTPYKI